jgi:surface protein
MRAYPAWCLLSCLAADAGYVMTDSTIRTAVTAWFDDRSGAEATYGHISTWATGGVTDMSYLFCGAPWVMCNPAARSFNEDIGAWDTSRVTTMDFMFQTYGTPAFNQDLSGWAVHSVTSMNQMFAHQEVFDQDLGWCVDDDVNLRYAFDDTLCESTSCGVVQVAICDYPMTDSNIRTAVAAWLSNPTAAEATYGHITTWDTSGVTDMSYLFCASSVISHQCNWRAKNFNEDIGAWDTSGVTSMRYMFYDASAFDQDLPWCVDESVSLSYAFWYTPCSRSSGPWCGVEQSTSYDRDGDCVVDAAPEGECCVSAYGQPFTSAYDICQGHGVSLAEIEASGCCPDDFLLRYSFDIYKEVNPVYTHWDCVSFVDKEACDLMGPPYTWGSCWASVYDQGMAVCDVCTKDNGFDVRACGGLFLQEAKGKWGDWWYDDWWSEGYCHEHSCCASDPDDCCEPNPAAVAGAVIVGLAVLAGLIKLYYKRCRKPAIAEPSEATSPKAEEATAVAPEAEGSPQETLTEEAPPPSPPAKSWFWRGEPKPEPEGEAEETLAEQPPPPPAKGWFAEPEGEPESAPFAPEAEETPQETLNEPPPPPAKGWFGRGAPEPEPEFEPEPEA